MNRNLITTVAIAAFVSAAVALLLVSRRSSESAGQQGSSVPTSVQAPHTVETPSAVDPAPTPSNPYPAKAIAQVGEKKIKPINYSGRFQRIRVQPKQEIPVEVTWPADDPHDRVWVQPVHGGRVDGGTGKLFSLKESKSIQFVFTTGDSPGLYQVLLRRGSTEEAVDLWVSTSQPQSDPYTLQ